jgi:hypothetical protein
MSIVVDIASPADDQRVRQLLRNQVMPGRVQLSFRREPDFSIGCAVTGDDYRILVARSQADDRIVGVACRSTRRVFLNGREQRIGYLGQLRIDERYRGRWLVSRGFTMLEAMHRSDPLPAYLASIVDGNEQASGVLVNKTRRGFPAFRKAAHVVTLALRLRSPKPSIRGEQEIAPASVDQIDDLVEFLQREGARRQLCSVWTADALRRLEAYGLKLDDIWIARRSGTIAGVLAMWDQSAYKQSIVCGYSGWLKAAAPFLPRRGTELRSAYAALVCIAGDNHAVFDALLREVYNAACRRKFEYLLIGLDRRDPLLYPARVYSHVPYASRLYLASWDNGGLCHEPLDARPAYVDIATL